MQSHPDGRLSDEEHQWLTRRADGGFAMVTTAAAYVSPAGKAWDGQLGVHDDAMVPHLARLAGALREKGAVSTLQLHHAGARANPTVSGHPRVAPWDDPDRGVRALSTSDITRVVESFIAAATRAEKAGFDGVNIHGAHGYLLCEFLDGRRNVRDDGYGGPLVNRSRIIREVVGGIRSATGPTFQVSLRLSPERHGVLLHEAQAVTAWALASGLLDYVDLSLWDVFKEPQEQDYAGSLLIDHFSQLERADCRLLVAGNITSAAEASWCLEHGADAVLVGTGGIIHHDFARRALEDPNFRAMEQPVSREHLAAESVGPKFMEYLATDWDDFVCSE